MSLRRCAGFSRLAALLALLPAAVALPLSAQAPTLKSIQIDGSFGDWTEVLANPRQVTQDGEGSTLPCKPGGDRDCQVPSRGRDLSTFAWTWDDVYLYVYVSRFESSTNEMSFWFYADLDGDRLMGRGDRVFRVRYQGSNRSTSNNLFPYSPVRATGDAMVDAQGFADGYDIVGNALSTSLWSEDAPNGGGPQGRIFEERVPWAQLGVPPGSPIFFHVSSSNSANPTNIAQQVDDNLGGPGGGIGSLGYNLVSLEPDSATVFTPGGTPAEFPLRLRNEGNQPGVYEVRVSSSLGLPHSVFLDGDCTGAAGTLLATDANGDGDFIDPGDFLLPAADSDANGILDTGLIAAGEEVCFVVRLETQPGQDGLTDETLVVASHVDDPDVRDLSTLLTFIGTITLGSDQSKNGVAGQEVRYPFEVCNSGGTDTVDLSGFSSNGLTLRLFSDPDCDGLANELLALDSDGNGVWDQLLAGDTNGDGRPDTGPLAQGTCTCFVLGVRIPPGAPSGQVDVTSVVGEGAASGASSSIRLTSTVAEQLILQPDYTFAAGTEKTGAAGQSVFFPMTIQNNGNQPDVVSFAANPPVNDRGWVVEVWSDPNGDGNIADGQRITEIGPLAAHGGQASLVVEVQIPVPQTPDTTSATLVTATSSLSPIIRDTAVAELAVSVLETYGNDAYTLAAERFAPCREIFAEATGLRRSDPLFPVDVYALVYRNPAGVPVRTVDPFVPDAAGIARDSYPLTGADAPGIWSLELLEDGRILTTRSITVENPGRIVNLATDQASYPLAGSGLQVTGTARNSSMAVDLGPGFVDYVVLDPTGTLYLAPGMPGMFLPWSGSEVTATIPISPLGPEQDFPHGFTLDSVQYPTEGVYTVRATYRADCGAVLDVGTTTFAAGGGEVFCDDDVDNDLDGLVDCDDPECAADPACFEFECRDGLDNDGDGAIDCDDPDCAQDATCIPESECQDGEDNDLDGLIDCDDPDCAFDPACPEVDCDDGVDNDGDGRVDCADPDCHEAPGCFEDICDDGLDNDNDGRIDCEDFDCSLDPNCLDETCDNGRDDDGDGLVDCDDPDCLADPSCPERICDDGIDNDMDGQFDCADDDCNGDPACPERICDDGVDNDLDGLIDCDDPDCQTFPGCPEILCDDGLDNDSDGRIDCEDPDCIADPEGDCDGDGSPNGEDCDPADPTAFAVPPEVRRLHVRKIVEPSGNVTAVITWDDVRAASGTGTVYDGPSGILSILHADRGFARAGCFTWTVPLAQDPRRPSVPGITDGFYYLVRARNGCGPGSLGLGELGQERVLPAGICP